MFLQMLQGVDYYVRFGMYSLYLVYTQINMTSMIEACKIFEGTGVSLTEIMYTAEHPMTPLGAVSKT